MSETASAIARAQLAAFRQQDRLEPLLSQLGGSPADLLKVATWSPAGFPGLPAQLREANADELEFSAADLAYRRLYPGLDIGIYAASHSMGVPSVVGPALVREQLDQLSTLGIQVWENGLWVKVMDQYRQACAQLVGGSLEAGDVAWFPNVSEALSAVLEGLGKGKLVYSSGHFTTGHYVHHQWAQNTGGTLVEVSVEADGSLPTEKLMAAVDADTTVLSISHALFESGWLQDLPAIAAQLKIKAPNAMLLVDAYQTAGTVPLDAAALGDHVVITAAGHKQLRSSAGAGFLYLPKRWLNLTPKRTGWWGHAEPFAFEKGPVRRAHDATRFRSGTPGLVGMAMLLGELAALASSAEGDLEGAVMRARRVTSSLVERMRNRAEARGLRIRGDWSHERRGAFVCIELEDGAVCEALAHEGIITDFRPRFAGSKAGWLRVSGNSAAFPYELDAVIDTVAERVGS